MLEGYLPAKIYNGLKRYFDLVELNEIRLRLNNPVIVSMKNKKYYLSEKGFCDRENAIICDYEMLKEFVMNICESSVYSVNDYLKCGYITLPKGIRVGICGEVVTENGVVKTVKNFQSVNIRIPHFVDGCCLPALEYLMQDTFLNTLVLSPPGAGKTTFIRDVVYQMSKRKFCFNVLVADERNEIANITKDDEGFNLGEFVDVYTNCSKEYAFKYGIRSMRPDIIVTDEIDIDRDLQTVLDATNSGVKVLATIHAENIQQLKYKRGFEEVFKNRLFDRYVVLSCKEGAGTLNAIYDAKLQCIYCR